MWWYNLYALFTNPLGIILAEVFLESLPPRSGTILQEGDLDGIQTHQDTRGMRDTDTHLDGLEDVSIRLEY